MITQHTLIPVILSGGAGTRLWPVSRESHPKPFMLLPDGYSLLQKTFIRAQNLPNVAEIMTITNNEYFLKSKAAYQSVASKTPQSFLLEPSARNTAPAIALAALRALHFHGEDSLLLILPADHLITELDAFNASVAEACTIAALGKLVTFGITPLTPETGFGYIETRADSHDVVRFVEKPNRDVAETYLASGRYLWNSGMFCMQTGTFLQELATYAPSILENAKICWQKTLEQQETDDIQKIDAATFDNIDSISIDYALMEKSSKIACIRALFSWQDIGSWDAYKALFQSDTNGNTVIGDAILIDSQNNFIQSEGRMIASIGINNLAIIDTPDAMLITHRDRAQEVKHIVQTLKNSSHESYLTHRTVIRPWGSYTILEEGPCFKIKRIVVNSGASLSLQTHAKRSEHWVVVSGSALVVNGEKTYTLNMNESTFVPIGAKHRLSNPHPEPLIIIEVQTGQYLGEDDIVRLDDTYGRIK